MRKRSYMKETIQSRTAEFESDLRELATKIAREIVDRVKAETLAKLRESLK